MKLLNGVTPAAATYLHRDGLGSVRAITNAAGTKVEAALYKPFGEQSEWLLPGAPAPETKGWIGERFDADAGLQYLNARYYDPELGLFLQPDWFEVTKAGVGTNRFSYSFNDPVNKLDPGGNETAIYEAMQDDDEREDAYRHNLDEAQKRLKRLKDEEGDPLLIQRAMEDVEYYSSRIGTTREELITEGVLQLGLDLVTAGVLRGASSLLPPSVREALTGPMIKRDAAEIPAVENTKLANVVSKLYTGVDNPNRFGNGTAMDAMQYELEFGEKVFGKDHVKAGRDALRGLQRLFNNPPPGMSANDMAVTKGLIDQLSGILGYK